MLKSLMILTYLFAQPHGNADAPNALKLYSPEFKNHSFIPQSRTCWDKDTQIPLKWSGIPKGTKSLALLLIDQDVPRNQSYHWAVFNISPRTSHLYTSWYEKHRNYIANNSWGHHNYKAPCSTDNVTHHYLFRLYALNIKLPISANQNAAKMQIKMQHHILAIAELAGRVQAKK